MLSKAIFSADRNIRYDYALHSEMEKVLMDLDHCLASTKRVAEKSPRPNYQDGLDCLIAMRSEIEDIDSKIMSRQTTHSY